jgi:hypothetical protein
VNPKLETNVEASKSDRLRRSQRAEPRLRKRRAAELTGPAPATAANAFNYWEEA